MTNQWLATAALAGIVNSLAAAAALTAATALLLRLLPSVNASTRHAAWWLCLMAVIAAPLCRRTEDTQPAPVKLVVEGQHADVSAAPSLRSAGLDAPRAAIYREPATTSTALDPDAVAPVAVTVWLAGVFFCLARLLRSYLWLRGLKRRARPVPDGSRMLAWLERCPVGRGVRIACSEQIDVPIATGFLSPAILLPARLDVHLDAAEIDEIVTHELAHLARRDDWAQLAGRLIGVALWFHPVVRFILNRISREREMCCDEWVIRSGGGARSYAESLLKLAEMRRTGGAFALASSAAGSKCEITRRIEAILRNTGEATTRISGMRLGLAATVLGALAVLGAFLPGVVTLAAQPAPAQVAPAPQAAPAPPAPPAVKRPPTPPSARKPTIIPPVSPGSHTSRPNSLLGALKETGYGDLDVDDIIVLKNNGIDAAFLYEVRDSGASKLTVAELVRLRQHGIRPSYMRELRTAFDGFTANDIIEFHNNGVKPRLIAAIQTLGYGPYTPKELVEMSQHGVEPEFFEGLKE